MVACHFGLRFTALLFVLVMLLTPAVGSAAIITWTGDGGDALWSTGDNWDGNAAPANGDELIFTGSTRLNNENDLALTIANLTFDSNAGNFTLSGNLLTLEANAAIINDSFWFQTLEMDLLTQGDASILANAGDLEFSGDIELAAASTLDLFADTRFILVSGIISGDGEVVVDGEGTVELDADNIYTGGTTVAEDGALLLSGSVVGDTTVQGTLGLGRDDSLGSTLTVEEGVIVPVGGDRVIPGTVDLTIDTGMEVFGGFDLEFQGDVTMANTPELDVASRLTLSGTISGDNFSKEGAGTLTLAGSVTSAGTTSLNAGTTILQGSIANDVDNAALLRGTGTIGGNLANLAGGIVNPGNSIGTFNVAGDFINHTGAALRIEVDTDQSPLAHDVLDVGGTVTLEQDSNIQVVHTGTSFVQTGEQITAITSGGGITDQGSLVISNSPFINWTGSIVGNDYVLTASTEGTFTNFATTPNNRRIARVLEQGLPGTDGDALLGSLQASTTVGQFNNSLSQLTPQAYQAGPLMNVQTTQSFNAQLLRTVSSLHHGQSSLASRYIASPGERAAMAGEPVNVTGSMNAQYVGGRPQNVDRFHVFASGYGVFNRVDSGRDRTGFRGDAAGMLVGASYRFYENFAAGLAFGYASTDVRFDAGRGEADIDTFRFGPYVSYKLNRWSFDAAISYGYHRHDMDRNIRFGGIDRTAQSSYDAHDLSIFAAGAYDIELTWATTLSPMASLQYIMYHQESFTESGAAAANLRMDSATIHSLRPVLGARLSHRVDFTQFTLVPEMFLGWSYELLDQDQDFRARFVNTTTPFNVSAAGPGRNAVLFGVGVNAHLSPSLSAFMRYDGDFRSSADAHTIHGGLSFSF